MEISIVSSVALQYSEEPVLERGASFGSCIISLQNMEAKMFNDFLKEFKETLKGKGRTDFWDETVAGKTVG